MRGVYRENARARGDEEAEARYPRARFLLSLRYETFRENGRVAVTRLRDELEAARAEAAAARDAAARRPAAAQPPSAAAAVPGARPPAAAPGGGGAGDNYGEYLINVTGLYLNAESDAATREQLLAVLRAMLKLPHAHVERALGALRTLRGGVGAEFLRALLEQATAPQS